MNYANFFGIKSLKPSYFAIFHLYTAQSKPFHYLYTYSERHHHRCLLLNIQNFKTMKLSDEALDLYQRRDKVIRDKYNELNKLQQYSQSQIFHMLSEQFFLLERQLYRIVNGK